MAFLGREDDIARVIRLIDEPGVRLLTLTGTGGVGKTRLAVEAGRRVAPDFADGVRYVSLAELGDAASVLPAVARGLGIRGPAGRDPLDDIVSATRDRHLLLVLDNYEHLLDAAPTWLATLMGAAPRVKVLVTSRVPLNIGGEQRYLIQPFDMPGAHAPPPARDHTAVALFTQRARAVDTAFVLDDASLPTVVEICRQLDGLALAIELAAARTTVFTPDQILTGLSDRLSLLSSGPRDAPDRQRSIRDAITWSYDLLSEQGKSVFRRISVFTGGTSLDAIASIASPDGGGTDRAVTLALVSELVDHSLIGVVPGAAEPRYAMLETIREFGVEQLRELGEERSARDAHAAWCASLARDGARGIRSSEQVRWLHRLDREHANFRSAIEWLIDEDRAEDALDLAWDLRWFWGLRGYEADATIVFSRLGGHPRLQEPTVHRGKLLGKMGGLAFMRGQQDSAERLLHEAIELLHAHGAREAEVDAHLQLGLVLRATGALGDSSASLERVLRIARDLNDPGASAAALGNLGLNALLAGDTDAGTMLLEDALRVSEAAGDSWLISLTSLYLGHLAAEEGDDARAEQLLESSQATFQAMGNMLDQPKAALYLAELAQRRNDPKTARRHLEGGLAAARITRETDFIARINLSLGSVSLELGDRAVASRHLLEALRLYRELGSGFGIATCIELIASLSADNGDAVRGAHMLAAAAEIPRTGRTTWLIDAPVPNGGDAHDLLTRALGERAFSAAWAAGRVMGQDAAIAEAEALALAMIEDQAEARAQAVRQEAGLTSREMDVLRYLTDGLSNREIAEAMFVSRRTVATHIEHILTKLDLRSRTAAVAYAIRNGIA